jgi:hypothetical protein
MPNGYLTGIHRTHSPRQTLEDYARWMPQGIIRLANLTKEHAATVRSQSAFEWYFIGSSAASGDPKETAYGKRRNRDLPHR